MGLYTPISFRSAECPAAQRSQRAIASKVESQDRHQKRADRAMLVHFRIDGHPHVTGSIAFLEHAGPASPRRVRAQCSSLTGRGPMAAAKRYVQRRRFPMIIRKSW